MIFGWKKSGFRIGAQRVILYVLAILHQPAPRFYAKNTININTNINSSYSLTSTSDYAIIDLSTVIIKWQKELKRLISFVLP